MRIVSLIASATEIVCALGCRGQLVGRSHECDYPLDVQALPVCTAPKFNVEGSSYAIDQRVKAILQEGLAVYRVDAAILQELQPDVVVTQSQCEVCAVSLRDVEAALCTWVSSRPRIVSLQPDCLADVWTDIRTVAQAVQRVAQGDALVQQLQAQMAAAAEVAQRQRSRPRVACVEWIDPLMAAGNWMPELVELAGGENLFGVAGTHSPWLTWAELCAADPDVIIALPCGFDLARTRAEMPALTQRPEWRSLRAVRSGRVVVTDGNQYFNRPGPRLLESLEILAEILHPQAFPARHHGPGWQTL